MISDHAATSCRRPTIAVPKLSYYALGPSYAFVSEWGAQRWNHPGPAGHAYRQVIARIAGTQQPWWGRQSLNAQWGWQGRDRFCTILLGLLPTQLHRCFIVLQTHCKCTTNADGRSGSAAGAPRGRRGSAMVDVAAHCSLCESAMETITLNANAVQVP